MINKKDEEGPFTVNDEKIFERYLTFCGIGITNALLFQSSVIMYKRSDVSTPGCTQRERETYQTHCDNTLAEIIPNTCT